MTKSVYLLAGGGGRARGTYASVLAEALNATGAANPAVAVIGAANGDDPGFFNWTAKFLYDAGAATVSLSHLARPHADLTAARAQLSQADMVFVAGGDVDEGMRIINAHNLGPFICSLHEKGTVFCGISAGAIMLAQHWVRWRDPDDDTTAETFPCLGIAPVLCDVHAEEDNWVELRTLLKLLGGNQGGYGIPSGGALRVTHDGKVDAMGFPAVHVR